MVRLACSPYQKPNTTHTHTYTGNYFIVNGQYEPHVTLRPNEVVRLRLINGGAYMHANACAPPPPFSPVGFLVCGSGGSHLPPPRDSNPTHHQQQHTGHNDYLALRLPGCRLWEIAADGVYYAGPREKGTVVLVVGSRKDVLVRFWGGGRVSCARHRRGIMGLKPCTHIHPTGAMPHPGCLFPNGGEGRAAAPKLHGQGNGLL